MLRLRTLTTRFGVLYSFVIAIVGSVGFVVFHHLDQIRTDSERVMEETREQTICTKILAELGSLEALLAQPSTIDPAELGRARAMLFESNAQLAALEGHARDPSREEHQAEENRIGEQLGNQLGRLDGKLRAVPSPDALPALLEVRARAAGTARVLLAEAREEAQEVNVDLARRASTSRRVVAATALSAALLLLLAMTLGHRWVIVPLRELRDGAERVGSGERGHRIDISGEGELADLADTFNSMAERIEESQVDLEERVRRRTEEFLRAARLADMGVLASGIAHEINTPLASITSCAEGLRRKVESGDLSEEQLDDYTRTIRAEAFRARDITTRMLGLVRQEPMHLAPVTLEQVLTQGTATVAKRAERGGVALDQEPCPDVTLVISRGELVQIVTNLLANAVDATPAGGSVRVRGAIEADAVAIEVDDEGEGIPTDHLERIFEPFFTTKAAGAGTGLGLALVATLIESRSGTIDVTERPGGGTRFRVVIPRDWNHRP